MTMRFAIAVLAASMLVASPARAERASAIHKSQEAAVAWLDLVDSGQYAESWDHAATSFQYAISKPRWSEKVRALRAPLGPVRARRLKWAKYTETLPDLPSGQYVVLEYETRFDNRVSATEKVTPVQDNNGVWKVSSYAID
ncbi:DUF4019 domain-containing protein [Massilia cavernae]|uniref:DUF4019 domain-containing protein n=1 Tax=Massilia cavernae TaxID=2320864 RepID=A0A418Y609_9BURK|nr:DUF4019 domain-containing protein [Massilia cavernae]RJG22538.1 DUF4019 domain-containing protein [Massilia cavernae]